VLHENDIAARTVERPPSVDDVRVLESCHSLWVFESARGRFRRVPRGTRLDMPPQENEWTPYYRLELDASSGAFSVGLNPDDTRVLRSWLHVEPCRHCSSDQTSELSVEALRRTLSNLRSPPRGGDAGAGGSGPGSSSSSPPSAWPSAPTTTSGRCRGRSS
jgi:hypothetical protein